MSDSCFIKKTFDFWAQSSLSVSTNSSNIAKQTSPALLLSLVSFLVLSRLDYGSATLAAIPTYIHACLTGSRLCSIQQQGWHTEDGSTTLILHCSRTCIGWVQPSVRNEFRLAVLVFCCRSHTAPTYPARDLHWVADNNSRQRLRSSATHNKLSVPRTRCLTVGDRAFGVAAARVWNNLLLAVHSYLQEASQDTSLSVVIQPLTFCFNYCFKRNVTCPWSCRFDVSN